jgi:hypothetical protein
MARNSTRSRAERLKILTLAALGSGCDAVSLAFMMLCWQVQVHALNLSSFRTPPTRINNIIFCLLLPGAIVHLLNTSFKKFRILLATYPSSASRNMETPTMIRQYGLSFPSQSSKRLLYLSPNLQQDAWLLFVVQSCTSCWWMAKLSFQPWVVLQWTFFACNDSLSPTSLHADLRQALWWMEKRLKGRIGS